MFLNLRNFYRMFPDYDDFRIPMWSDWREKDGELTLSIAIPGYEKGDFELFVDDGSLLLKINPGKDKESLYSIVSKLYASSYDFDEAVAEYKNGVLKVTIPKTPKKKQKLLSIKIS